MKSCDPRRHANGVPIESGSDLPVVWAVELDEFDVPWLVRLSVG